MQGFKLTGFSGQSERLGRDLQELCGVAKVKPGFDPVIGGVPVDNQIRRMVETSLEAVALCGASLLSDAFAPVPSPSERGFLNSSPQAEPSVRISRTGLPR